MENMRALDFEEDGCRLRTTERQYSLSKCCSLNQVACLFRISPHSSLKKAQHKITQKRINKNQNLGIKMHFWRLTSPYNA